MTVVDVSRRDAHSTVRVTRVRRVDPPFDDELSPDIWAPPNQLAFDWSTPAPPPSTESSRREAATAFVAPAPDELHLLGREKAGASSAPAGADAPGAGPAHADAPGTSPARTGTSGAARTGASEGSPARTGASGAGPARAGVPGAAGVPPMGHPLAGGSTDGRVGGAPGPRGGATGTSGDAKLAVRRFVAMFVEVLNGYRPAAHLRHLAAPLQASAVIAQGTIGAQRVAQLRKPVRPGNRRDRAPGPVAVIRIALCEPRPGAVEASVVLVTAERTWALALRLELRDTRWSATALRVI